METSIASAMKLAEEKTTLDKHVINLFSHEAVLAILLSYCVDEFKGLSEDYILQNCFVGEPRVRKIAVDRDTPNAEGAADLFDGLTESDTEENDGKLDGNARIHGINTVDKSQTEGTAIYDIIFLAQAPNSNGLIQLIINVEVQNDAKLEYWEVTRGIYYCARMISAQKNRVFYRSEYQKIQKVYSIWICPYAKNGENTITKYDIRKEDVYGLLDVPKSEYDKMETVVITMNAAGLECENDLIRFLSLLLNREMPVEQRTIKLEEDYHLQMTESIREDVSKVCNYSDAMIMLGEQKGEKRGIEIGERRGAIKTLIRMVNKGKYTIEEAAEEAGITVPEFKAEMQLQAQPG